MQGLGMQEVQTDGHVLDCTEKPYPAELLVHVRLRGCSDSDLKNCSSRFAQRMFYGNEHTDLGGVANRKPFWQAKAAERPQIGNMVKFLKVLMSHSWAICCCSDTSCSCFHRR